MARYAVTASAIIFLVSMAIWMSFGRQTDMGRFAEGSAIFSAAVFVLSFLRSEQKRLRFLLEFGFWPNSENNEAELGLHREKVEQRLAMYKHKEEGLDQKTKAAARGAEDSHLPMYTLNDVPGETSDFKQGIQQVEENIRQTRALAKSFGYQ